MKYIKLLQNEQDVVCFCCRTYTTSILETAQQFSTNFCVSHAKNIPALH